MTHVALPMQLYDEGSGAKLDIKTWNPKARMTGDMTFYAFGTFAGRHYSLNDVLKEQSAFMGFPLTGDAMRHPASFKELYKDKVRCPVYYSNAFTHPGPLPLKTTHFACKPIDV